MEDLSARVGISKSAIYHHVPGKTELPRRREFDHVVTDLVRAAVAEGDLRPDVDAALTARLLFGMVNSLIEWYRPTRPLGPDDLADALVATAFDGLRREAPALEPTA